MNRPRDQLRWPVLISVWASFLLYSAVAAPVPGVNEPHYLCKAKHFWQPDWCSHDFFLTSPNAHTVFYATIGGLTTFLSFEQAAWIGRALATLLLAWGWVRCLSQIFFTPWSPLWTAWAFLALASIGNFSGEWLVGGVEGKVFAYGLLLAALADVQEGRLYRAGVWTGVAISIHPVVGVWGLLAFLASQVIRFPQKSGRPEQHRWPQLLDPVKRSVPPLLIALLVAVPGLIPVVQLITETAPAETKHAATYIQVFFRLAHHLDPMKFYDERASSWFWAARAYLGYALLLTIWAASLLWGGRTNTKNAFDRILFWSVVFALAGIAIGYGPRPAQKMPLYELRMNLLKFYPFRLADVLVPIAVSISLIAVLERTWLHRPASAGRFRGHIPAIVMSLIFGGALWRASTLTDSNRYANEDRDDWLAACHWIYANLPSDAYLQTPTNGWAFKWFARRAEYVSFKDCPQDAKGIVEWNRRLNFLKRWYDRHYSDKLYSNDELRQFRKETGLTHLLVDRLGPMEAEPIYENESFRIYDLTRLFD